MPTPVPTTSDTKTPPPRTPDLVGRKILGNYEIVERLGRGGVGSVYLARQALIDQEIAIKVLNEDAAEDRETVERFKREARVITMLTHPNIIRVFVFGLTDDDLTFMAMEYVEGRSLREELHEGPLDELKIIKIMKQACSALAEAHDLHIYHRDLKPENILLTEFRGEPNFVKILDFGIAKIKDPRGEKQLTQAGIVYGTPEYISPEQAQASELDHRTDIYSLGCIMYEMYTGQVPFTAKTSLKTLEMQAFQQAEHPGDLRPGKANPALERIIIKAMSKNVENRYSTALDMFDALEEAEETVLRDRKLDARSSYLPGGELSGIFRAVKETAGSGEMDDRRFRTILTINIAGLGAILLTLVILIIISLVG